MRQRPRFAGWIAAGLAILSVLIFFGVLAASQLLPVKYLLIALLVSLVLLGLEILILFQRGRAPFVIGLILAVLIVAVFAAGTFYVHRTVSTVRSIATARQETVEVGIYVRADDPNDFNQVASQYLYGILDTQDRAATDAAVTAAYEEFGFMLSCKTYTGLPYLMEALFRENVDAVIMNRAYLDVLEEMEGYEDIRQRLREVHLAQVTVEEPQEEPQEEVQEDRLVGTVSTPRPAQESQSPEEAVPAAQEGEIFTVFISGIDNRGALIARSRSDVNILMAVNTATRQVLLISTPRDYYVPLSISGGVPDKLTHAGIYGVQVSMDTLAMLYHVNVDYYFRVNFGGFEDIIDTLGGVEVWSDYAFSTEDYSYSVGNNYMDGAKALAFVRERYAFSSGDRQRGKNQMAVIRACLKKCMSPEILLHYTELLDAAEGSFETSVPYDLIAEIVRDQLSDGGEWNVVSYSADGYGASKIPYSMSQYAYVMVPDQTTVDTAMAMLLQLYLGQEVTQP